jgi:hypothetical protein
VPLVQEPILSRSFVPLSQLGVIKNHSIYGLFIMQYDHVLPCFCPVRMLLLSATPNTRKLVTPVKRKYIRRVTCYQSFLLLGFGSTFPFARVCSYGLLQQYSSPGAQEDHRSYRHPALYCLLVSRPPPPSSHERRRVPSDPPRVR